MENSARQVVRLRHEAAAEAGGGFPLSLARRGERLRIVAFLTGKGLGRRLGDLGLHKGSIIEVLHRERNGAAVVVHDNNRVALGAGVAQMISVKLADDATGEGA